MIRLNAGRLLFALITLMLAWGVIGVLPTYSQSGDDLVAAELASQGGDGEFLLVGNQLNYQGQLVDDFGEPRNEVVEAVFQFFTSPADPDLVYLDGPYDIFVENGLLQHDIIVDPAIFDGRALWLEVLVNGIVLLPRQEILPAPYAFTLRPGATIYGGGIPSSTPIFSLVTENPNSDSSGIWVSVVTGTAGDFFNFGGVALEAATTSTLSLLGDSVNQYGGSFNSQFGTAIYANTDRLDKNYGLFTEDNIYVDDVQLGGAIMRVVRNGGKTALETGDVVVFAGVDRSEQGFDPVLQVAKAEEANSTAVAGVVFSAYDPAAAQGANGPAGQGEITPDGPAAPGDYLLVVVEGPALVKFSAAAGAVQPGYLVAAGSEPGRAASAPLLDIGGTRTAQPGVVLGKALEAAPVDGMIYIYVTLQ